MEETGQCDGAFLRRVGHVGKTVAGEGKEEGKPAYIFYALPEDVSDIVAWNRMERRLSFGSLSARQTLCGKSRFGIPGTDCCEALTFPPLVYRNKFGVPVVASGRLKKKGYFGNTSLRPI